MVLTRFFLLFLVIGQLVSCTQSSAPITWHSPELLDHPLVGRIWDSSEGRFIDYSDAYERIAGSYYLLLGEKHDNPDHHHLQQAVLQELIRDGRIGQVTFEMINEDKQALLDSIYMQSFESPEGLRNYLQWDENGWDWEFYGPLLETALTSGKPIRAGNISDATMGQVYGSELDPKTRSVLDASAQERLHEIIDESHCGLLPESQFPAMARVQQARDASMASNLISGPGVSALIAGNFHVRYDLGVPRYLLAQNEELAPGAILSLSFMEVVEGEDQPEAYLEKFSGIEPFDLLWFTPSVGEQDYCAQLQ